eukprot:m.291963 g.291963  ORF g.291963 m.291963 type:complete len:707 (-) comp19990_c0_seq1:237-2357(-)
MDPAYEFDAPTYVDFEDSLDVSTSVDSWFEGRIDTPERKRRAAEADREAANTSTSESVDDRVNFNLGTQASDGAVNSNTGGDFGKLVSDIRSMTGSQVVQENDTAQQAEQVVENSTADSTHAQMESEVEASALASTEGKPEIKKSMAKRFVNLVTSWASTSPRKVTKNKSGAGKSTHSEAKTPGKKLKAKRTAPHTPQCLKRKSTRKSSILSSEDRELQEIREKQEELKRARKLSSSSYKRLSNSKGYHAVRSEPKEFQFKEFSFARRDSQKKKNASSGTTETKPTDTLPSAPGQHGMVLRSVVQSKYQPKPTAPRPFKFHKTPTEAETSHAKPFVPAAQSVQKFFHATPDRFHTRARGTCAAVETSAPAGPKELTRPVAPNLRTAARAKTDGTVLSSAEQEDEYMRQLKPFRAQKVNPAVLDSTGDLGLPVVHPRGTTCPRDIQLKTEARAAARGTHTDASDDHIKCEFKARPVPPASEPFRPRVEHRLVAPSKSVPRVATVQHPYSTRQRVAEEAYKQAKEDATSFTANPVPSHDMFAGMPNVHPKPPTEPHPFKLLSDALSAKKQQRLAEKMIEEALEREQATMFKASEPLKVSQPFVPMKSSKPLTEQRPFQFNLNKRTAERSAFDEKQRQKRRLQEQADLLVQEQLAQEEAKQIKEMRRSIVHKAQPVPKYHVMQPRESTKPLTVPFSPALGPKRNSTIRA